MALDVYFREDIKNILRATLVASEGSAALVGDLLQDPDLDQAAARKLMQVYKQGFASALGAVALAFGLDVQPPWHEVEAPSQSCSPVVSRSVSRPALKRGAEPPPPPGQTLDEFNLADFLWARSEVERQRRQG